MIMVYPIELISRGCSSHQFKLRKEHKSRMDTRLLVISMSSRNVHLIITRTQLLQELFFTMGLQLRSGKSPTRNYSIYFAMII